jgi:membrane protein implicated in regulation of membrane protease activity
MFFIIALVLAVIVAVIVLGAIVHLLFSPWLLLAAVAVLAWVKFRPRRTHQ